LSLPFKLPLAGGVRSASSSDFKAERKGLAPFVDGFDADIMDNLSRVQDGGVDGDSAVV
jgi:hypothetical protein